MKKIKLVIEKDSYFIIRYNFDIRKYINGDINVDFYFQNKRLFTYITQIKYFIELLLEMIKLLGKHDKILEKHCNQNLFDEYVSLLKGNITDKSNIESKTLLDLDNNGYIVFLYWQNEKCFIEIVKMNLDLDMDGNVKDGNCYFILKYLLQEETLMDWIKILNQVYLEIGSKLRD